MLNPDKFSGEYGRTIIWTEIRGNRRSGDGGMIPLHSEGFEAR
jgi:hypothetical protein